jgi:hypothetical protein
VEVVTVVQGGSGARGPDLAIEALDATVRDLFDVGLTLAAAASISEGLAAERLATAVDQIDQIVRDIRRAAFAARGAAPTQRTSRPCPSESPLRVVPTPLDALSRGATGG